MNLHPAEMPQKPTKLKDIRYRANLFLQILLYFNVYLSALWFVLYGICILWNQFSDLKDFHGLSVIVAFMLSVAAEVARLYAGYSGNLRAQSLDLNIFLVVSVIVQLPLMSFLFLTTKIQTLMITVNMCLLLMLLLFEFVLGLVTWQQISAYQCDLYRLKREACKQRHPNAKEEERQLAQTL